MDEPVRSPFALPRGWLGYGAGLLMRWNNDPAAVYDVLGVAAGDDVLEVGYGPGRMIRMLAERSAAQSIWGVDPSPEMRLAAARYNARWVASGRVHLELGTADATKLEADRFDRIVSIHNVALWPDLTAGLDELRRVMRPRGTLVLAWHGGLSKTRLSRSLALSAEKLVFLEACITERFEAVERIDQDRDVVFRARSSR